MKVGDLVRCIDPWGPDPHDDEEYHPMGMIYRRHSKRVHRWWVRFVSPAHIANELDCLLDGDLEVLSEAP